MKHTCIICKEKFHLSKIEIKLIERGEVAPDDVNICEDCADRAEELYNLEYELNSNII